MIGPTFLCSDVLGFSFSYAPFSCVIKCGEFSIFFNNNLVLVRLLKPFCSTAYTVCRCF